MELAKISNLWPLLLFLLCMMGASMWARKSASKDASFVNNYYIGGRDLGGFVLAMTTVATYSSVSTFVGGPGVAWTIGYGWLYMAIVQIVVIFLVLGVFGKKIALVSRKIDAVTIIDIIRSRYQSDTLANLSAFVIVLFFCSTMVAQFVGGAKLFEAVTGLSYGTGLTLFGVIVVFYTAIGGFKGVAVTDALCAMAMFVGLGILFSSILDKAGGYEAIMQHLATNHPDMLEPLSRGKMPVSLYISQWLLVGVCTLSLPQSVVRCISSKDSQSIKRAMIVGTFVIGLMTLMATWIGVISKGVLTGPLSQYGTADNITPKTIISCMSPFWAGVTILGPVGATISTIDSLLLSASSSLIKDIYMHKCAKEGKALTDATIKQFSMGCTFILGALVFFISLNPPSLIWQINMFAFGGLETAFFWVLILGLFWHKANKTGAMWAMAGGVAIYCTTLALKIRFMNIHQILFGIVFSGILFYIGNKLGKDQDESVLRIFFPEKYDE